MPTRLTMMHLHRIPALGTVLFILLSSLGSTVLADDCAGLIATGSIVSDGRSILLKNRHLHENNQKPFYGNGTFTYWGIGDGRHSFCRMGMNEKGLAIANFDPPPNNLLDDGVWQYTSDGSSASEDDDMRTVLGEYTTVEEAALWLAHHARYPCQWALISQESGIGAIVAMDTQNHSHISYIRDGWVALGNVWYCENTSSSNNQRIEHLITTHLNSTETLTVRDVVRLLGRDIKAGGSDATEPVGYNGTYQPHGLTPVSCRSAAAFLSGDARWDGALAMAWVAIGQTTHLCPFFPLGASYVHTAEDIPQNWTTGLGIEQYTDEKQEYAEATPNEYYRNRVQEIHNYTLPIQDAIFDRYEQCLESIDDTFSTTEVIETMQSYANSTFQDALQAYREERPMTSETGGADHHEAMPASLLLLVVLVSLISFLFVVLIFIILKP
ncbi:MAG: hypothetical protein JXA00_04790 [Candidatus Thermoplasmatota archaeon]|nr:hypothetical protein [Candidatus Thermoplasmatota archaeon]